MADRTPTELDGKEALQSLIRGGEKTVVSFYASWCGPCKTLQPILDSVAAETDIAVGRVNVEEQQLLAQDYQIQGIPTIVFFSDEEQIDRLTGVRQREEVEGVFAGYQPVAEE